VETVPQNDVRQKILEGGEKKKKERKETNIAR